MSLINRYVCITWVGFDIEDALKGGGRGSADEILKKVCCDCMKINIRRNSTLPQVHETTGVGTGLPKSAPGASLRVRSVQESATGAGS